MARCGVKPRGIHSALSLQKQLGLARATEQTSALPETLSTPLRRHPYVAR